MLTDVELKYRFLPTNDSYTNEVCLIIDQLQTRALRMTSVYNKVDSRCTAMFMTKQHLQSTEFLLQAFYSVA